MTEKENAANYEGKASPAANDPARARIRKSDQWKRLADKLNGNIS